jgi:AmmeMemoRadiSam system protein A
MSPKVINLSLKDKKFLLELARKAIEAGLKNVPLKIDIKTIPERLKKKMCSFVTLTIDGNLRGCIGKLIPIKPLYLDVLENAEGAAFHDPRFCPLSREEFKKVKIEISILGPPQKIFYKDTKQLLGFLKKKKPGVILKKGFREATFLPQVWEELADPIEFLSHLSLKAGLLKDDWKEGAEIYIYYVEKISE